jgi:hypothetical protein
MLPIYWSKINGAVAGGAMPTLDDFLSRDGADFSQSFLKVE